MKQEKIRGQRGTLPVQALGYVKFGKAIFRRPFGTEVCFQDVRRKATSIWFLKNHSKFCLSWRIKWCYVLSMKTTSKNKGNGIYADVTENRLPFKSQSINNFCGIDISQPTPSESLSVALFSLE